MMMLPDVLEADFESQMQSQAIGDRFRQARELSPLSRTAFCAKHGLNCYTVQSWELGRSFSRSPNATKFCEALAAEGIVCTEDWLLEGVGPAPYLESSPEAGIYVPPITTRQLSKKSIDPHECLIQKEIALFREHSQKIGMDGVVIQVSDEAMAPDYDVGEIIGGLKVPLDQIHNLHQNVCLVEATPNHFLVRRLLKEGETCILLATNKNYPLITLNQITSVAEIVWRRRVSSLYLPKDILAQAEGP